MFRPPKSFLSAVPLRNATPVSDRQGSWETTGDHAQFELQTGGKDLPQGWVELSFELSVKGTSARRCLLSVYTSVVARRMLLGNSRHLRAVTHLPADIVSIQLELTMGAGLVTISLIAVRTISKAEAGLRVLTTFLTTGLGSWRQAMAATRTALRLLQSGGPTAVMRWIIEQHLLPATLLYAGDDDAVFPVERLNDAQRYEHWMAYAERHGELAAAAPPLSSNLIGVLILAGEGSAAPVSRTVASLQAQTQSAWRAVIAQAEQRPPRSEIASLIRQDDRLSWDTLDAAWRNLIGGTAGDFVTVLDAGDTLAPHAFEEIQLFREKYPDVDIFYSDEDVMDDGRRRSQPFFKPEWSPELLAAFNYFGRLTVVRRTLAIDAGGLSADLGPAAAWDLNLRASEKATRIQRIPQVLGHRAHDSQRDRPKPSDPLSAPYRETITRHWARQGITATVETQVDGTQRSTWDIADPPLVSIIIPNKNKLDLLKVCLDGLLRGTDYPRIEIIIVDNLSNDPALEAFYQDLEGSGEARIVRFNERFNYSAACNAGARVARGELLLFLNNDIEVISPDWLAELVRFAQRPGVGVVGTMLVYPNGRIQHAGVVAGPYICGLIFRDVPPDAWGVFGSPSVPRNYLAIMGACQMVRREAFERVGGFDETYRISNSDVALGARLLRAGYRTAYTPFARLTHLEGATRGHSNPEEDMQRSVQDLQSLGVIEDPYFHPSLSLISEGAPAVRIGQELSGRDLLRKYASQLLGQFPLPTTLDLFNDADVAEATGLERSQFLWTPQPAAAVDDIWSAARYCIDLLRTRADLRQRFPDALSAGTSGAFVRWLTTEGRNLFHLSSSACEAICDAFGASLSDRVRQVYLLSDELRAAFPLALTPVGCRGLFRSLLTDGRKLPVVRLEMVWWFFLECAERPAAELVRTYLFTPQWQRIFPDGLTIFGRANLANWLIRFYKLDADWADPRTWPIIGTPAEHLRLAYSLREYWQRKHPRAFETLETTQAFLNWLVTPECGLSGEALTWCEGLDKEAVGRELIAGGVNILGHFCYPSGLRTSVESITEGFKRVGLGVSLRDVWEDNVSDDPHHADFNGLEFYDTTIIHTQPEPFFDISYSRSGLFERNPRTYRIGYWYWELDDIPRSWLNQAAQVDELWAATRFVADAMHKRFDLPIFQMMPGVELPDFTPRPRSYFGLAEDRFTFLFVFHMLSIMERKNPLGLIKAYRLAFGDDNHVSLVLKTCFGEKYPGLIAEMRAAAAGTGITIIDAIYTLEDTLSLMQASDCYVSLHRSEGFGLTMAEAMLLGKPTIATGYSGNVDFMDASNSLLVDYKVVSLDRAYLPYSAGSRWAEPSVDHAARLMRQVYENQTWARDLGEKAKLGLRDRMSIKASGRRMAVRLHEIEANRRLRAQPLRGRAGPKLSTQPV